MHVLPQNTKFLPYSHVNIDEWVPNFKRKKNHKKIVIGHAPTNRDIKGTELILKVLNDLKINYGSRLDFHLIEGISNSEAKLIYQNLDILIDQIYLGWYGGLAVELMALAKPVMCYIRSDDLDFIPSEMKKEIPIININEHHNLRQRIVQILDADDDQLFYRGKKMCLCRKWHNPKKKSLRKF